MDLFRSKYGLQGAVGFISCQDPSSYLGPRVYMQMLRANGCVVALDWYLHRAFFRSGVSGMGVLMHALCLFDGRGVWWRCY